MDDYLLNKGVYTVPNAARLVSVTAKLDVSARKVNRWLWGQSGRSRSQPLWSPELGRVDDTKLVSFRDLVELMFVAAFRSKGVSLHMIRKVIGKATDLINNPYPLSSPEFRTDGQRIIAGALRPSEGHLAFDLETDQLLLGYVFDRLWKGVEYGEMSEVARLWPLGKDRKVVVDPSRRFGEPIIDGHGIPTSDLHDAYEAEGSYHAVSTWFGVPELAVEDAVDFERQLRAA